MRQAVDAVQQGGCREGRGQRYRAPAAYGLHASSSLASFGLACRRPDESVTQLQRLLHRTLQSDGRRMKRSQGSQNTLDRPPEAGPRRNSTATTWLAALAAANMLGESNSWPKAKSRCVATFRPVIGCRERDLLAVSFSGFDSDRTSLMAKHDWPVKGRAIGLSH
jgi:hypothetical protein